MTTRKLKIDGKVYVAKFDEELILDTVRVEGSEELLSTKNKAVKKILSNADKILSFKEVKGVSYAQ